MYHQESLINKLMDNMERLLDRESSHVRGNSVKVQEIENLVRQPPVKEMLVSLDGKIL